MEPRRLNLLDAMILTAAVAVGLGAARWWFDQAGFINPAELSFPAIADLVAWLLLPPSLALLLIRLRRPRPAPRRLVRQPGFQASLLVGLATVAALLNSGWALRPVLADIPFAIGCEHAKAVAPIIAIGWILARLLGARRGEPSSIDGFGRLLGWAWITLWVARIALDHLPPLDLGPPRPPPIPRVIFNSSGGRAGASTD